MQKPVIIFDYDGVIVDSFGHSFPIVKDVWGHTEDSYRTVFEGNPYGTDKPQRSAEENEKYDQQLAKFEAQYRPCHDVIVPFDGIREMLSELSKTHNLIIVSSTTDEGIQRMLDRLQLAQYFTRVLGATTHRSKVAKFRMVLEETGKQSDECTFVTDTLGDIREARHLGIPTIGVTWGFHDADRLQKDGAVQLATSPQELLTLLTAVAYK